MKLPLVAAVLMLTAPAVAGAQVLGGLGRQATPEQDGPIQQSQPQQAAWQEWVKPGMKATWYTSSATVPGALQTLEPDENGRWVNKQTGQRYGMQDRPGGSSSGFEELLVSTVSPGRVVMSQRTLQHVPISGPGVITSVPAKAVVAGPQTVTEYWLPPAVIAGLEGIEHASRTVSRFPFEMNGRTYNAVRISDTGPNMRAWRTYDADSGLLLQLSLSNTMSGRAGAPGPDGRPTATDGDTMLINVQLVGLRQTSVPGPGTLAPASLGQITGAAVTLIDTFAMGEFGANPPVTQQFQAQVRFEADLLTLVVNGQQSQAPAGGMYLDPQLLARLQPGQTLDEDPITGMTVRVANAGNGLVVIEEINPLERTQNAYDAQSGLCVQQVRTSNAGGSATTTKDIRVQYR